MSKLKDNLPDSLELLLDTMCNTFGGIMFIALALVIISQLVTDKVVSESPDKVDPEEMATLEHSVKLLQKETRADMENIQKYKELKKKASGRIKPLLERIRKQEMVNQHMQWQRSNLERQVEKKLAEKDRVEREIADLERQIQDYEKDREKREEELKKLLAETEKELEKLRKELAETKSKTIKFGMEESTSLQPYVVVVHNDKIYRAGNLLNNPERDVRVTLSGNKLTIVPVNGTALGTSPERELERLFASVDKNSWFIWLSSDKNSFSALMVTREYLRARGYQVKWDIDAQFVLVDHVDHKASF